MNGTRHRRITADDLHHLVDLDSDPEVMRYLNGGAPVDQRHLQDVVLPSFIAAGEARPHLGVWVVETLDDGQLGPEFLGWVSLRHTDPTQPDTATLGFRFKRSAWGRGYATATAATLLAAAFDSGAVARVVATTYQDNFASQRVLEKLGFTLVERFRPRAEDLVVGATYGGASEVWEGDELVFELTTPPLSRR
ncbi:MAG TPA: GNAT family N-acetyltransferase [Trueperaceae bacterium]|nr:GNAT family N-acetyltransferase [Trueperaceae bacterium]